MPNNDDKNSGAEDNEPILKVENLKVHFPIYEGVLFRRVANQVKAVDGLNFEVEEGETLGLVGESGCGKSTTGRGIVGLEEPTEGRVVFDGEDIAAGKGGLDDKYRRQLQMIFQDPFASLNPRMTVEEIIAEPLKVHGIASKSDRRHRIQELMDLVGLDPRYIRRYPHEFSGGQRQRIGIARALATRPKFIVCDEPVSALDVSIQAQILNLLEDLQDDFGLTYLFIAHDVAAVRHISDRIAVMYLGNLAEVADSETLYENPLHPYTESLMSAVPIPDPEVEESRERIVLHGDVPSPIDPPSGCVFHTRCPYAWDRCKNEVPEFQEVEDGHHVACHMVDEPERRDEIDPTQRKSPFADESAGGEDDDGEDIVEAAQDDAPVSPGV
jgi:oligopeptide transport system ATP-binding protein